MEFIYGSVGYISDISQIHLRIPPGYTPDNPKYTLDTPRPNLEAWVSASMVHVMYIQGCIWGVSGVYLRCIYCIGGVASPSWPLTLGIVSRCKSTCLFIRLEDSSSLVNKQVGRKWFVSQCSGGRREEYRHIHANF